MTNGETKRFFKVFWAWQEEEEQEWLKEMARQGWILKRTRPPFYTFERGEPADVEFRLDFKSTPDTDFAEYLQLFSDAGWEHVDRWGSWIYFRRPAGSGTDLDLYTDNRSRAERYKRQMSAMLLATVPLTALTALMPRLGDPPAPAWVRLLQGLSLLAILLVIYAAGRLHRLVRKLDAGPKE